MKNSHKILAALAISGLTVASFAATPSKSVTLTLYGSKLLLTPAKVSATQTGQLIQQNGKTTGRSNNICYSISSLKLNNAERTGYFSYVYQPVCNHGGWTTGGFRFDYKIIADNATHTLTGVNFKHGCDGQGKKICDAFKIEKITY